MDLSKIEDNWQHPKSVFVASDPNGIVFMSSRSDWLFKSLQPLDDPKAAEVWASRQYQTDHGTIECASKNSVRQMQRYQIDKDLYK